MQLPRRLPAIVLAVVLVALGVAVAAALPVASRGADVTISGSTDTVGSGTTDTTGTITSPPVVVLVGVSVGGVDVGGLDRDAAIRAVTKAYLGTSIRVTVGSVRRVLYPTRLGIAAPIAVAVDRALARTAVGDVSLRATYRAAAIDRAVRFLLGLTRVEPRNAHWRFNGRHAIVVRERAGAAAPPRALRAAIVAAIRDPALRADVRQALVPVAAPIDRAHVGPAIVIRRGANRLVLFRLRGGAVHVWRSFGVATGQAIYPTPTGLFAIVQKQRNPWWYPPNSTWAKGEKPIPPGPGNPLGTRWMGLSADSVGIHGTPDDASIGYSASHGCIRMHIPDAEWLFEHVELGTPVRIVAA
jgi:hypothetical protein